MLLFFKSMGGMSHYEREKWFKEFKYRTDSNIAAKAGKVFAFHVMTAFPEADAIICADGTRILYDEESQRRMATARQFLEKGGLTPPEMPEDLSQKVTPPSQAITKEQSRRGPAR